MDDWFVEPAPELSRHDAYTKRLVAWGWLTPFGHPSWDPARGSFFNLLRAQYTGIIDELNKPCFLLGSWSTPWWEDPERPASRDHDLESGIADWNGDTMTVYLSTEPYGAE